MTTLERLKQFWGFRHNINISRNLREKFLTVTEMVFGGQHNGDAGQYRLAFQSLVRPFMIKDGRIDETAKGVYRKLLAEYFDHQTAGSHAAEIMDIEPMALSDACTVLRTAAGSKAVRIAEFIITLAVTLNTAGRSPELLKETSLTLGMREEEFENFLRDTGDSEKRKQHLRNSSCSIIATLVILLIFVLTAKYLQSVIFGILLACILMPLEKFFEKCLRHKLNPVYGATKFISLLILPLKKLSGLLTRQGDPQTPTPAPAEVSGQVDSRIIRQAVALTVLSAFLIFTAACTGLVKLTGHYMHDLQQSVKKWEQERLMSNNGGGVSRSDYVLEKLRQSFEGIPLAQTGLNYLEQMLKDPAFREKITAGIINSRGDIGETVTRIFSTAAAVVCDILLTIFFALLFLLKFAEFHAKNKEKKSGSEYVVRNIFNGVWLPDAGEKVVEDTCRIINGILFRLRRWLKGYITLILVDSTVYTICFFFLGVPFFLPLGMVAGCGIALPYLGPVISCVLTLTVSIAAGGATVEMIAAIVICYLIYNGIIEQFILYPAVIGDSLGLNTLETIIVVLLGALFAGIPGMIFSLPTASVAKYIIPMIYHGFTAGQSTEERGIS